MTPTRAALPVLLVLLAACGGPRGEAIPPAPAPAPAAGEPVRAGLAPAEPARLPPVPEVRGPLAIRLVYPAPTDRVDARDSSFLFGSVGTGDATLSINGRPVRVWPNGAWLAWIPLPPDSLMVFRLVARRGADSAVAEHRVARLRPTPPGGPGLWLDATSVSPTGRVWWPADEYLTVSLRASEDATVRLRLPDGTIVPFARETVFEEVPWGIRAFDGDTLNLRRPVRADRFVALVRGRAIGPDPGPVVGAPPPAGCPRAATNHLPPCRHRAAAGADTLGAWLEAIRGRDTVRTRWDVRLALLDSLPALVEFDDDTARTGETDRLTVGRAAPSATYHWFFPTGTRAPVVGRINDDLRIRLSRRSEAWAPASDAQAVSAASPAGLRARVGSVTLTSLPDRVVLRVPVTQRVPFQVTEEIDRLTLRLYRAAGDINWMRYGPDDSLVTRMAWAQDAFDEVTLTLDLAQPVWGYRTRWDQTDLLWEIRRPPLIDRRRPLRGRLVVVDPGHPPLGATGPTGLREADANLAVSLRLRALLEEEGARVIMVRTTDTAIGLWPRVRLADSVGADLLVSIHNNALPDGVNPFTNNGSSVFYNHPRSLPLAREIQRGLVRQLRLRDLGVARGDLALVRPTWMPSVLTEGLFMMLPEQEAALRTEEGQRRYAQGVLEGIERFLQHRARE